jgi:hypothetical protein
MSVVDLSMVDLALGARHAVSLGTLGIAVAMINHDSSLVARLFVAAAASVLVITITRMRRLQRHAPI